MTMEKVSIPLKVAVRIFGPDMIAPYIHVVVRMRMITRTMKLSRQIRERQGSPPSVLDKAMFRPPAHFEEVACGRSHSFHQHYLIVGPTYDGIGTWCTYFLQPNSIQRRSLMSLQEGSG